MSHTAVSKALTIIGMFMPKFGFTPLLGTATFAGGLTTGAAVLPLLLLAPAFVPLLWAVSVARSHDPISWERATEKNRNI
ncbi:MAG: hypothetical protein JNN03_17525 [Rubrivivax sp.]|nr:hypothetical protein [Rubrivivax sp.]